MRISVSKKIYSAVGCCIYCGLHDKNLGREHIVPFGLAGNIVLPKSSCKSCEAITSKIEKACLRGILGDFRIRHGFPSRRKKDRPLTLPIRVVEPSGIVVNQDVPIKEFPRFLMLFRQRPPGILVNRDPSNIFDPDICFISHGQDDEKLFGQSHQLGTYRNSDFCLLLAKIAHSYAVAEIGYHELSKYEMPLTKLLLEQADSMDYYVGGQPKNDPPAEIGVMHKLQLERGDRHGKEFVVVHIRLFAHFGAPQYTVVVGVRPLKH